MYYFMNFNMNLLIFCSLNRANIEVLLTPPPHTHTHNIYKTGLVVVLAINSLRTVWGLRTNEIFCLCKLVIVGLNITVSVDLHRTRINCIIISYVLILHRTGRDRWRGKSQISLYDGRTHYNTALQWFSVWLPDWKWSTHIPSSWQRPPEPVARSCVRYLFVAGVVFLHKSGKSLVTHG